MGQTLYGQTLYETNPILDKPYTGQTLYEDKPYTRQTLYKDKPYTRQTLYEDKPYTRHLFMKTL